MALLVLVWFSACHRGPALSTPEDIVVKVLATADVHGWLNPLEIKGEDRSVGGLAELALVWEKDEGVWIPAQKRGSSDLLILDSGDMWTGPPESTLAQGDPVVQIFNLLGYHAAALGNHEFDFGLEVLRRNRTAMNFPLLAANVDRAPGGPDLGFRQPSHLVSVRGIPVGIIGLATVSTPQTTFPTNVEGIRFTDYESSLRREGKILREKGARFLVVVAHESLDFLEPAVASLTDLPIRLVLGGHDHRQAVRVVERSPLTRSDDVILLSAGAQGQAYGRIELGFVSPGNARDALEMVWHREAIVAVGGRLGHRERHPQVAEIVDRANRKVSAAMAEPVGLARDRLVPGTLDLSPLGQLVADAWIKSFPQAEIAITNMGGLRQPIEKGPVTHGTIFGVLPFANHLVLVRLTPSQLREALSNRTMVVGGMRYRYRLQDGQRRVTAVEDLHGRPLEEGRRYPVITTDFLYAGGDHMTLAQMDPAPVYLGVNWREPVIELFRRRGAAGVTVPDDIRALPD